MKKKYGIFLNLACLVCLSNVFAQVTPNITAPYHFDPPKTNDEVRFISGQEYKQTYYINADSGSDSNNGLSENKAFKSLNKLKDVKLHYSSQVLLKGGLIYHGCIDLINLNETIPTLVNTSHIHIGSYGKQKATIDCAGYKAAIWVENSSNIDISDLKITGNGGAQTGNIRQRYGIRILSTSKINNSLVTNVTISNINLFDIFLLNPISTSRACKQWNMDDNSGWGWGIFGSCTGGKGIENVFIKSTDIRNVDQMGIRFMGSGQINGTSEKNCSNIYVENCNTFQTGGPGMQFNKCNNSSVFNCHIVESGNRNDNRKWGRGSGLWTWGCVNFLIDHNIFDGAQGIADCCGAHIDFNCTNVVIQNCLSRYNAGGFIEILGLNKNCAYRYNVSINDGWRNKEDPAQDFWGKIATQGCILTVNGHNNEKKYKGPYQTYIYNNTVINTNSGPYKNPFVFNIATSVVGLVIVNNIFWIPEQCKADWSVHKWKDGKPFDAANDFMISYAQKDSVADVNGTYKAVFRKMDNGEIANMDIIFKNNIYQKVILPPNYWNEHAIIGNPEFANSNGSRAEDYIPTNRDIIYQGIPIPKLETDQTNYGLKFGGLIVKKDFFGNTLKGNIIGAIMPAYRKTN